MSHPVTFDTIYGASWSPDGKAIAFGCGDNTVRAIDAKTGEQIFFRAPTTIGCLAPHTMWKVTHHLSGA